jgi:Zn-dependent peptidase ImmA (M78 family)
MLTRVKLEPQMIRWAVKRSGVSAQKIESRFPISDWQKGSKLPTLKQVESFAKLTMTPLGYLFLTKPPVEKLPVPDYRTFTNAPVKDPSPNLLDTLNDATRRQQWMKDYVLDNGQEELPFVASMDGKANAERAADGIRKSLGLDIDWTRSSVNWEDALKTFREAIEAVGIMVSCTGVVGLNNKRKLDPEEFRGFVIADTHAPLIFVNSADTKSAQMFTLAHELAHIWLGKDGVFNLENMMPSSDANEQWCNTVAAELLVPRKVFLDRWNSTAKGDDKYQIVAKWFKVSPLVVARRSLDLTLITKKAYFAFYAQNQLEWAKLKEEKQQSGGNFYTNQNVRLGRRFGQAVIQAAKEGRILYHEAYQLTGLHGETFERYAERLKKDRD